jgi:hypothetical protein
MKFFSTIWLGWVSWFQLKKLEQESRSSRRFQKQCERLRCFNLAELEERHRQNVEGTIAELRVHRGQLRSGQPTPGARNVPQPIGEKMVP